MKLTVFHVSIKKLIFQLIEDQLHRVYIIFFAHIDQNIISINNDNNFKFFGKKFSDIALKTCKNIERSK